MSIFTNIGTPVFGGEMRPETVLVHRKNPATGAFGGEVRPEVCAVTMRT